MVYSPSKSKAQEQREQRQDEKQLHQRGASSPHQHAVQSPAENVIMGGGHMLDYDELDYEQDHSHERRIRVTSGRAQTRSKRSAFSSIGENCEDDDEIEEEEEETPEYVEMTRDSGKEVHSMDVDAALLNDGSRAEMQPQEDMSWDEEGRMTPSDGADSFADDGGEFFAERDDEESEEEEGTEDHYTDGQPISDVAAPPSSQRSKSERDATSERYLPDQRYSRGARPAELSAEYVRDSDTGSAEEDRHRDSRADEQQVGAEEASLNQTRFPGSEVYGHTSRNYGHSPYFPTQNERAPSGSEKLQRFLFRGGFTADSHSYSDKMKRELPAHQDKDRYDQRMEYEEENIRDHRYEQHDYYGYEDGRLDVQDLGYPQGFGYRQLSNAQLRKLTDHPRSRSDGDSHRYQPGWNNANEQLPYPAGDDYRIQRRNVLEDMQQYLAAIPDRDVAPDEDVGYDAGDYLDSDADSLGYAGDDGKDWNDDTGFAEDDDDDHSGAYEHQDWGYDHRARDRQWQSEHHDYSDSGQRQRYHRNYDLHSSDDTNSDLEQQDDESDPEQQEIDFQSDKFKTSTPPRGWKQLSISEDASKSEGHTKEQAEISASNIHPLLQKAAARNARTLTDKRTVTEKAKDSVLEYDQVQPIFYQSKRRPSCIPTMHVRIAPKLPLSIEMLPNPSAKNSSPGEINLIRSLTVIQPEMAKNTTWWDWLTWIGKGLGGQGQTDLVLESTSMQQARSREDVIRQVERAAAHKQEMITAQEVEDRNRGLERGPTLVTEKVDGMPASETR